MSKLITFFIAIFLLFSKPTLSLACESCTIPRLGRDHGAIYQESKNRELFFKYFFEQQNWDVMDAHEAHELHHDGYHFHDKTTEDFHHFALGRHFTDNFSISLEIPYIIRRSLEIDDHSILGSKQKSEGWGDLHVIGDVDIWKNDQQVLSLAGGVKFPTGETDEVNSIGTKFEPELQPGTGSYDYLIGGVYKQEHERVGLLANIAYVFKTEGDADFESGDLLSTSLFVDYLLNPQSEKLKIKIGIDTNFQYEQKQKESGIKIADSGGLTLLSGPAFSIEPTANTSIFASVLFPAFQDLGGVHQELDYSWSAGGKVVW